jgi:cyclophilin family peptidyl-prolyl cis-trans isomerase
MRPCHRLWLFVLALVLISGWNPEAPASVNALRGAAPAAHVRQAPAPAPPAQAPAGGRTQEVHAPPLQAPAPTPAPGNPVAIISTSLGDITIELFADHAPVSVENFLQYVKDGFYTDTVFHRVKAGFMIQGGGFTASMTEKPTRAPIQNEATNGLRNARGTLAMARMAALRSATAQFYINVVDNRRLDHTGYGPGEFGYAVFGRVLAGMEVVDRIAAVPTRSTAGMDDVPVEPVIIRSVTLQKTTRS